MSSTELRGERATGAGGPMRSRCAIRPFSKDWRQSAAASCRGLAQFSGVRGTPCVVIAGASSTSAGRVTRTHPCRSGRRTAPRSSDRPSTPRRRRAPRGPRPTAFRLLRFLRAVAPDSKDWGYPRRGARGRRHPRLPRNSEEPSVGPIYAAFSVVLLTGLGALIGVAMPVWQPVRAP